MSECADDDLQVIVSPSGLSSQPPLSISIPEGAPDHESSASTTSSTFGPPVELGETTSSTDSTDSTTSLTFLPPVDLGAASSTTASTGFKGQKSQGRRKSHAGAKSRTLSPHAKAKGRKRIGTTDPQLGLQPINEDDSGSDDDCSDAASAKSCNKKSREVNDNDAGAEDDSGDKVGLLSQIPKTDDAGYSCTGSVPLSVNPNSRRHNKDDFGHSGRSSAPLGGSPRSPSSPSRRSRVSVSPTASACTHPSSPRSNPRASVFGPPSSPTSTGHGTFLAATFAAKLLQSSTGSTSNNILVGIRVRPLNKKELKEKHTKANLAMGPGARVEILPGRDHPSDWKDKVFTFDHVFNSSANDSQSEFSTQENIYDTIGQPLVQGVVNGYNSTFLAYGQTGSGKTYSVLGSIRNPTEWGMLPRACAELFRLLELKAVSESGFTAKVRATYLEVYTEKVYDLLSSTDKELKVHLDTQLGCVVDDISDSAVKNFNDVLKLLDIGGRKRATGETDMNAQSSRSHAIFSLDVRMSFATHTQHSRLHFVDLAGSERHSKSKTEGETLKEGIAINQSLTTLGRVISVLSKGDTKLLPPFRDSKLTMLLREALSGNSKTALLACVSPAPCNLEETVGTLEFASRCKLVKTEAKKNQDVKPEHQTLMNEKMSLEAEVQRLTAENRGLKEHLQSITKHLEELEKAGREAEANEELLNIQRETLLPVRRRNIEVLDEMISAMETDQKKGAQQAKTSTLLKRLAWTQELSNDNRNTLITFLMGSEDGASECSSDVIHEILKILKQMKEEMQDEVRQWEKMLDDMTAQQERSHREEQERREGLEQEVRSQKARITMMEQDLERQAISAGTELEKERSHRQALEVELETVRSERDAHAHQLSKGLFGFCCRRSRKVEQQPVELQNLKDKE